MTLRPDVRAALIGASTIAAVNLLLFAFAWGTMSARVAGAIERLGRIEEKIDAQFVTRREFQQAQDRAKDIQDELRRQIQRLERP